MHIKKKDPYQFWHFRDTRKEKFKSIKPPELPLIATDSPRTVKGFISHHILLPINELPAALINRLKADLTLRNPVFDKARKYGKGFVSYAIPEFLRFYQIDSDYIGLPRSVKQSYLHKKFETCGLKLTLKDIRPDFEEITWPEKGTVKPWFYQKEAIENILKGNVIIKLRCGLGKTMLCLLAISKLRLRALILVRTNILLKQWIEAIQQVFDVPEEKIGIINGKTKREGLITVATEQSLANLPRSEKRRMGNLYGHVCVDEAHEVAAATYRDLMTYFKARYLTGLSATPFREDKLDPVLKLYVGPIVEIDDLGPFVTEVRLRKTMFTYHFDSKKSQYHKLVEALIHDEHRNHLIIEDLKNYYMSGKIVVCYSSRIEHMHILEEMLKKAIPDISTDILASRRHGATLTIKDQEKIKEKLRNQEIQILHGGKIIEQGFDAPPLSVAVLATPTKSKRLVLQVLGRCQREYPGKGSAILHDYVDEFTKILLFQFFQKNQKIYKDLKKVWLDV